MLRRFLHGLLVLAAAGPGCRGDASGPARTSAVAAVRIVPVAAWLQQGDTVRLAALPLDATGTPLARPMPVLWRSNSPTVARVDSAGLVTAVSIGDAAVAAAVEGVEGVATIHVIADPSTMARFRDVTAGDDFTCAVDSLSTVFCWGLNAHGQLGNGGGGSGPSPTPLMEPAGVEAVTAGTRHACARDTEGHVWCWGWNSVRQVGPSVADKIATVPRVLPLPGRFTRLAAGSGHSCALGEDGTVLCWGSGALGQLGSGPQPVAGFTRVEGVPRLTVLVAGHAHTCGLDAHGAAWCWGWNEFGQLGAPSGACEPGIPCTATPIAVRTPVAFTTLTAGSGFTCGLDARGGAHCWGANASGQLGHGPGPGSLEPIPVDGIPALLALEAGRDHACGATGGGVLFCWGANDQGQLGDGTDALRDRPVVATRAPMPAMAFAAGGAHTCAIAKDQRVICWGMNADGQLGVFPASRQPLGLAPRPRSPIGLPRNPAAGVSSPSRPGYLSRF